MINNNIIDPIYGMKFRMPHTIVHIVDNSAYTGGLPTTIAEDPSMLTTLVVTGTPMGVDNKVVPINRTDVLKVAYGLSGNPADNSLNFNQFGQTIDYPISLIEQGAPIRMLRVTPEGSTFGLSIVVIQWRREYENDIPKLVVRFKKQDWPRELRLDMFKSPEKVNETLIRVLNRNDVKPEDDGAHWKQRVFINNISAGRGLAYNNFATCINPVVQGRRPRNIRYNFLTLDTITGSFVENMTASLVNVNQNDHPDSVDTVNVQVMNRLEASSIIIPFVNEPVIHEVYGEWLKIFDENLADEHTLHPDDHYVIRRVMNVNIFDILYGKYIWNGNQGDLSLPYYHVDQLRLDIPQLPLNRRINTVARDFDWEAPDVLYSRIEPEMTGLTRDGDNVYVGDLFLDIRRGGRDPLISMITSINQISGSVTPLVIPEVFVLVDPSNISQPFGPSPESAPIKFAYNQEADLLNAIRTEVVVNGDIVARTNGNIFELQVINGIVNQQPGVPSYVPTVYNTNELVYRALNLGSIYSKEVGNIIGRWSAANMSQTPDIALGRVGATILNMDEGRVYVNGFRFGNVPGFDNPGETDPYRMSINNFDRPNRFPINMVIQNPNGTTTSRNPLRVGRIPQDVSIMKDFAGTNFDIIVYPDSALAESTFTIMDFNGIVDIVDGGEGYKVEDILRINNNTGDPVNITLFRVISVDDDGKILELQQRNPGAREPVSMLNADNTPKVHDLIYQSTDSGGADAKIKIHTQRINFGGNPKEIVRYVISGTIGSIYRISRNPLDIPANYYNALLGLNMMSQTGGVRIEEGSTGFFDDRDMHSIVFKWKYSELLVRAYRGEIDPRIKSPTRVPSFFLFDGAHNTIIGTNIQPELNYPVADIIEASTIFTEDEKIMTIENPNIISPIIRYEDIDVKQAMYDLMESRIYQGIPDEYKPVGPGSGLSLHLDAGTNIDASNDELYQRSFARRFNNPNCTWDLGGWVDRPSGQTVTFVKKIADDLIGHIRNTSINKPFVMGASAIPKRQYNVFFPDLDEVDWIARENRYESGGNIWYPDVNNNLIRRSQRTVYKDAETSDFVQESNVRTLTRMIFMAQTHINGYVLEYSDNGTLKTLEDELNNMFSLWPGSLIDSFNISITRKINIDGGEIVVCTFNVVFRGLILRVPIIVNVNRREN